ncbi:hypothetical protein GGU11DRAFT_761225 [Lentinula aff. detonsa]|nr:hypothetical protein GGU11DRAFT_761225 [Lentinula aff. detonsa]
MTSHGYNTRGNQQGTSDLNQPSVFPSNSPKVSGEYDGELPSMDSPLTSIASDTGPLNNPSAPAGPEFETAPAGPDNTASAGPDLAPPDGIMEQELPSAGLTVGGRNDATRNDSPERHDFVLPSPIVHMPENEDKSSFKDKGKGPDARNWGEAALNESDTDPEVQAQILDSFENISAATKEKNRMFSYLEQWQASETERIQREVQAIMADRIQELETLIKAAQLNTKFDDTAKVTSERADEKSAVGHVPRATWKKRREGTTNRPSDLIALKSHIAHILTKLKERSDRDPGSNLEPSDGSSGEESDEHNSKTPRKKKKTKISSNSKFKKFENRWGQNRPVDQVSNERDAPPNSKVNLSFKDSAPKGKTGVEAKGKQKHFSANSVTFDWADDVEETYYSDSVRSTQTTTDSSVSDSDDTGSLPDLIPVSGSEDEASISDSDDADSLPELIAVSDSGSGDEWDVEVDDGEFVQRQMLRQMKSSKPRTADL